MERLSLKWSLIEPCDAVGLDLRTDLDIDGPVNEFGEVCPWPWEMQQVSFDPQGMHVCSHCGQPGTPGLEHPDFGNFTDDMDRGRT